MILENILCGTRLDGIAGIGTCAIRSPFLTQKALVRNATIRMVALALEFVFACKLRAEERVEYRFEDYTEDRNRMHIQTHGLYVEKDLVPQITARGQFMYDSISGASPSGGAPKLGSDQVPLNAGSIQDIRRALSLEVAARYLKNQTTTPQISYSVESDYESQGLALNHTFEVNEKNTAITLGVARNFDRVKGVWQKEWANKDTWDGLLGFNQILDSNTHVTANLTLGMASGYLNDPYKGVNFYFPYPGLAPSRYPTIAQLAERRPDQRFKQVGYLGLSHYFPRFSASAETSYRLHHDDWGIWANTVELQWHQKIGSHLTISPLLRWHHQSAANFYAPRFLGSSRDPAGTRVAFDNGHFVDFEGGANYPTDTTGYEIVTVPPHAAHYSADYRLSHLEAITYGIGAHWRLNDRFSIDLGYQRYEMNRLDRITPKSSYPKAHVVTLGGGLWF